MTKQKITLTAKLLTTTTFTTELTKSQAKKLAATYTDTHEKFDLEFDFGCYLDHEVEDQLIRQLVTFIPKIINTSENGFKWQLASSEIEVDEFNLEEE